MAKIEKIVTLLLVGEAGLLKKYHNLPLAQQFEQAKKTGWADDPDDSGGQTMCGITIGTYKTYCRRKGYPTPTGLSLKNINYERWLDVLKTMYWDRWIADKIENQSIANILVDWVWASGSYGITIPQRLLGVQQDGNVGPKTLEALSYHPQQTFFNEVVTARKKYIEDIIRKRPANAKFRKGWLNRINSFTFEA